MTSTTTRPDLRRARAGTAAGFLTQGLILLSLTTRLPEFQDRWDLSDVQLSLVLLMMILLAGAGSVVAETLAKRRDSALLLRVGLLVVAVGWPRSAWRRRSAVYVGGIAAVRRRPRRRRRDHQHAGGGARAPLRPADPAVVPRRLDPRRRDRRRVDAGDDGPAARGRGAALGGDPAGGGVRRRSCPATTDRPSSPTEVAVPWRPILLVGVAMVLFYMVDTAVQTWGPLFLDHTFATPERYVALSALAYLLASGAVRLAGDRLVARFGAGAGAAGRRAGRRRWHSRSSSSPPPGRSRSLGFAILGAGVAVVAPLSFSAAARIAGGEGFEPARAAGPGRRRDRPVQPVQLRRRAARLGADRPGRRGLAADRLRGPDGAGARDHPAGPGVRAEDRARQLSRGLSPAAQFLSGCGTGRPGLLAAARLEVAVLRHHHLAAEDAHDLAVLVVADRLDVDDAPVVLATSLSVLSSTVVSP